MPLLMWGGRIADIVAIRGRGERVSLSVVSRLETADNDSGGDKGRMKWMTERVAKRGRMPSALGVGAWDWIWSGSAFRGRFHCLFIVDLFRCSLWHIYSKST